jgi:hypothetical protein
MFLIFCSIRQPAMRDIVLNGLTARLLWLATHMTLQNIVFVSAGLVFSVFFLRCLEERLDAKARDGTNDFKDLDVSFVFICGLLCSC